MFIYSAVKGHLGHFYLLAILNCITHMGVKISLQYPAFNSFGYLTKSRIAGSYSNFIFNFLRNHHIVFYNSCIILHSHQQCTRFQFLHILANICYFLFFSFVKIVAILTGMWWHLIVVFICIYLMISDVEHLFMCLAICVSSAKCLFKLLFHFLNWTVFGVVEL